MKNRENKIEKEEKGVNYMDSGGDALCTKIDANGKKRLTHAFSGSIEEYPKNHSDTCQYQPDPAWSLGSNTRNIEARLRRTKKILGYAERTPKQYLKGSRIKKQKGKKDGNAKRN